MLRTVVSFIHKKGYFCLSVCSSVSEPVTRLALQPPDQSSPNLVSRHYFSYAVEWETKMCIRGNIEAEIEAQSCIHRMRHR